jgi:tetratricopeptide (TPR) repeat protein
VKARTILENMLAARPDQASVRMRLAYTLVMLGDRERALKEADRALAAMPLSRDAFGGTMLLRTAAGLHANAGAEERALDELEQLIRMPAGVHVQELKLDPVWDPLRSNPRFQKLIADHSRDTASP